METSLYERGIQLLSIEHAKGNLAAVKLMASLVEPERIRQEKQARADFELVLSYKYELAAQFADRKRRGLPPPNVFPHPDHLIVYPDGTFAFMGPTDEKGRRAWELLKINIKAVSVSCKNYLKEFRANPDCVERQGWLADNNAHLRSLKRLVPKGWSWKEEIWTLDSDGWKIAAYLFPDEPAYRGPDPRLRLRSRR